MSPVVHEEANLSDEHVTHAANVDKTAACEDGNVFLLAVGRCITAAQDGLAGGKDNEGQQEVESREQEVVHGQAVPDNVCEERHNGVADDLRVFEICQPLQCLIEAAVRILHEVLEVVIHTPPSLERDTRAPNKSIQQGLKHRGSLRTELLNDIWMAIEEIIAAIVVVVTVRTDREQVLDHGLSTVQAPTLNGPEERRDGLGAHPDLQQLCGPPPAGCHGDRLAQRLLLVGVDGPHYDRGAFQHRSDQDLRDQCE
mmetsp:Transcript_95259/g.226871  ORF Transcript_95259/g.226871 Transcript_95259/m.226871 type:complete len:255 (+) Transcript_95259:1135-1899(+)